jgi:outer membrane receptor protein involved in Fe transport
MQSHRESMNDSHGCSAMMRKSGGYCLALILLVLALPQLMFGQLDEGAIVGTVTDAQGAAVAKVRVQLKNIDTNFELETQTDSSGVYTFQPVKIGHYSVSATAAGFSIATKTGLELHIAERLQADIQLKVGSINETVEVHAQGELLQTQEASTGQVMTTQQINDTPLNGRNWVFIAQLAAGVDASNGSRGQGNGDFIANGMRATQNNFILDGVDNNSNAIDFLNGASYVVRPPPDALQEFKVQTGSFSAEFGHSAGAVVNASIKSGTNQIHGDAWEYVRNNDLTATDWDSTQGVLPYHQNQFGFTLGGPILKNKLFAFGDYEGNRIIRDAPILQTIPTMLERTGNFSELLNTNLTGAAQPILLFEPSSGGTVPLGTPCGEQATQSVCDPDAVALKLLAAFPTPNANNGKTFNNYAASQSYTDSTNQFDIRVDWNLSSKDQVFSRASYLKENEFVTAPFGPILDGGGTDNDGTFLNYARQGLISENHVFSNKLINQLRFAYNWGHFSWLQQSYNDTGLPASFGLGGIPGGALNGGLPNIYFNEINGIGTPLFQPTDEHQDVYQIIDDLTMIHGNHTFKFGVDFQNVRYSVLQPTFAHEAYGFDGHFTSRDFQPFTGWGLADFLEDDMNTNYSSSFNTSNLGRWYRSAYVQDDWKVRPRLTVNLGLRYDFFQPPVERDDHQALYYPTSPVDVPGTATGVYILPSSQQSVTFPPGFTSLLASEGIALQFSGNRALVQSQKTNFAPRVGFAYQATNRLVVRSGFGIFYGGLENLGNYPNLGVNEPYDNEQFWGTPPSNCGAPGVACPTNGITLETGPPVSSALSFPSLRGADAKWHSTYSMEQNLSVQYSVTRNMAVTMAYVGSESRHLGDVFFGNGSAAIAPAGTNTAPDDPFPLFGTFPYISNEAISNYNGLQATLERHFSNGLSFLSTYTWSHSLDDAREPLPSANDGGDRTTAIIGIRPDYSNSPFDTRHRFTFSGTYQLPFGAGRKYVSQSGIVDKLVGGWSSTIVFRAQSGQPFTVYDAGGNLNGALVGGVAGASTFAVLVGNPFTGGGTAPAGNPGTPCPATVKTLANWYNPCAFTNPIYPSSFPETCPTGPCITGAANVLPFLGSPREQIADPGYERIDLSLFKNFKTFEAQFLQFRADVFNLFNTPSWGAPSNAGINSQFSGQITGPRFFGNYTPDARFFQLALKYTF